jgi:putative ATP-dependent endonuclease of the OLD family
MKLTSITIENYRSITKAYKVKLGDTTVLVGPNNEGKSNVLLALVTAMNILTREQYADLLHGGATRIQLGRFYDWKRDYPIHLQEIQPKGQSIIVLEFGLTDDELETFREEIQSVLSGTLPLRISIGPNADATVNFHKQGPGAKALSKKSARIAAFVSNRLRLEHIPAVRTARSAQEVVEDLVARELKRGEADPEYQKAVAKVASIQEPILKEISENIKKTLVQFLPEVKEVRITISREERYRALRQSCSIVVDDGTPTQLQYKGDGVQSLAALAIMRHASEQTASAKHSVIAIEEPESHLHPAAIHELRDVLSEMGGRHQIVITTHNPLFIDRVTIASNIIVTGNKARPAKSINEIRDTLGVRASDNLRNATLILIVEGEDDRIAVTALLKAAHEQLRAAVNSGVLALDSLQGASNLSYKLGLLRDSLCNTYCFLDDDVAAREAVTKAEDLGLLTLADVTLAHCDGRSESEIEDLFDPAVYQAVIKTRYGVVLTGPKFKNAKKWSVRMRETFEQQGKPWSNRLEADVKQHVAQEVATNVLAALIPATCTAFDALTVALRQRLETLRLGRDGTRTE